MRECPILYMIFPCFNEEAVIDESAITIKQYMDNLIETKIIHKDSKAVFVDDGSSDSTWGKICELHYVSNLFQGIKLSRNSGHQIAIYAGMENSLNNCDVMITMDVDLQQDINAISLFIDEYKKGYEVVYGIRRDRNTDGLLKKVTAEGYYTVMQAMGCNLVRNSADFRLLSKKAAKALMQYKENNLFIRGLVPSMGFRTASVYFDVKERKAGESKYTVRKMMTLAMDGITSFSIKPIRYITYLGIVCSVLSFFMIIYIVIAYILNRTTLGWPSILVSIWFIGGVELLSIGIVGEYVGRGYMESKHRPRYFVDELLMDEKSDEVEK